MRHIWPIPAAPFPVDAISTIPLVVSGGGIESCNITFVNIPPGRSGRSLHSHEEDEAYYVLSGQLTVTIGMHVRSAFPGTVVFIPRGTPHSPSNEADDRDASFLSFRGPFPKEEQGCPAAAYNVAGAEDLFRPTWDTPIAQSMSAGYGGRPYGTLHVVDRSSGGNGLRLHAVRVEEGSSSPLHIHSFDQFYVIRTGTFKITIGLHDLEAGAGTLVVVPAGTVHRNWNDGPGIEEHLVIISPEPPPGEPLAVPVSIGGSFG